MAFVYDIKPNAGDIHTMNSYWFAVVVPFAIRDSFNHSMQSPASLNRTLRNPVEEASDLVIIDHDMVNWSVSSSKASHVSNANFTLVHSDTDYTAEIAPDDWFMFFVFNDRAKYIEVLNKVKAKSAVNGFHDGLKFVGRIDSVRKNETREPRSGRWSIVYNVTGNGFSEFDSLIYYNDAIAKPYPNLFMFLPDFGIAINDFIINGRTSPQAAIPALLSICLGVGPGEATKGFAPEAVSGLNVSSDLKDTITSGGLEASPNRAYRIPSTIAALLGKANKDTSKPVGYTYNDILNQFIGIQAYDPTSAVPKFNTKKHNTYIGRPLDGEALPYPLDFNKKTVWSILGTYLNAPINEMYTCLRMGPDGILPTFVCRQLPLSSRNFIVNGGLGTAFVDLPRWRIDDAMISVLDVGRSNAARFNYIFLSGLQNLGGSEVNNAALGYQRNPPIIDQADVMRAGLRMYDAQVSGTIIETQYTNENSPGRRWSHMMSDILMGGHLKYSGTVILNGVTEPICEGDNAVVKGVIYHIERVQHSGGITAEGLRQFQTTLYLTNGISDISDTLDYQVYPDNRTAPEEGAIDRPTPLKPEPVSFVGRDPYIDTKNSFKE